MAGSMMRATRGLGLAAVGAAAAGGLLMYSGGGGSGGAGTYQIDLEASPRTIDEGDLIEFVARAERTDVPAGEAGETDAAYVWDFDDGSPGEEGLDLESVTHRFVDGGAEPTEREVRVRVGASERTIRVIVNNVAPAIRSVRHSRPARQGEPVTFEASVTDPGRDDHITYTWDFGDGETGDGQQAEHTFEADGVYAVTLTANDGDDGEDTTTRSVVVGNGGVFTVRGDVALPPVKVERVVLLGLAGNPLAETPTGPCTLRISMSPEEPEGPTMVLTATLDPGLGERGYPIGSTSKWDGSFVGESAAPAVFFGDLSLPRRLGIRNIGGMRVGGPFWSRGGYVSVDYFDGENLELSYSATLVENIPGSFGPRHASVDGTLAMRVTRDVLGSGVLAGAATGRTHLYQCGRDETETFDIASSTPRAFARNVPFQSPDITVSFTRPVNEDSIFGNLQVDYRADPESNIRDGIPVDGTWELVPGEPWTVRFVPQAHLKDGVVYCVRVHAGKDGVLGRNGEQLDFAPIPQYPVEYQGACLLTRVWAESREWAIGTRVEFSNVRVDLYQASLAGGMTPLSPAKPTLTRIYPRWEADLGVDFSARVDRFPARVSVLVNGKPVYAPRRTTIRRPDTFSPEDVRNALSSLNFFGWRPAEGFGSAEVQARIEFLDDDGSVVGEYLSPAQHLEVWNRTEILSFDYSYLNVDGCVPFGRPGCDWSEGVPTEWLLRGRTLAQEGAEFTTQNFPVIETQPRSMGQLPIDEPPGSGPCSEVASNGVRYRCYRVGTLFETEAEEHVAEQLYRTVLNSYADIAVGFVPPGFGIDWGGVMVPFDFPGKRVVLVALDDANAGTVAHEFGHFFELDHCPASKEEDRPCPTPVIQGFRMDPSGSHGFNKHEDEGNQEAGSLVPVMHWDFAATERQFISTASYLKLFGTIAKAATTTARVRRPADLRRHPVAALADLFRPVPLLAQGADDGRLLVIGRVTGDGIVIDQVVHEPGAVSSAPPPPAGDLTLDLLDAAGTVLRSVPFAPLRPAAAHGRPTRTPRFVLQVPAPAGLHAVRVNGPGGASASRTRSASPPVVAARVSRAPSAGADARALRWTTSDPDGDEVRVSVYVRTDAGAGWRGVAIDTARPEIVFDAARLPAGARVTARLVAGDGFNTTTTEVDLGPGAPPRVATMSPPDGRTDVPVMGDVTASVTTALAATSLRGLIPLPSGRFSLVDGDGREIFADVAYQPGTRRLILTPVEPLAPGTRYTATIADLEDVNGLRLPAPVTWSFVTAGRRPRPAPE